MALGKMELGKLSCNRFFHISGKQEKFLVTSHWKRVPPRHLQCQHWQPEPTHGIKLSDFDVILVMINLIMTL